MQVSEQCGDDRQADERGEAQDVSFAMPGEGARGVEDEPVGEQESHQGGEDGIHGRCPPRHGYDNDHDHPEAERLVDDPCGNNGGQYEARDEGGTDRVAQ